MRKYIVYLTTNKVNNKIYVGVHGTETPYKFDGYLGCGVKVNDRSTYFHPKYPFEFAVSKYGPKNFIRKTLKVFDTLEDALEFEKQIVCSEFIARSDTYNVTLGGSVPPKRVKIIYQYDLEGNFIKEWESITEASLHYKCSSSTIGQAIFDRTPRLKFLWTDYKYDKLDLSTFKIDANKTKCYIYDAAGNLLKEFPSISNAAKYFNDTTGAISNSIKGKYCYKKQYYISDIRYEQFPIKEKISYENGFYKYDLEGNFIEHIKTPEELRKNLNVKNTSAVYRAIRTGNTAFGFQWTKDYVPKMKPIKLTTSSRKVGKYTKDGQLVEVFNTVREAKKDTCGAPNVLNGKRKTAGGYIWKYID